MKPAKVRQFLQALNVAVPWAQRRTGWTVSECPLGPWSHDGGKSSAEVFGVRDEPGDPHCNCFACGFKGTLGSLLIDMKHRNKTHPYLDVKWGALVDMVDQAVLDGDIDLDTPDIEEVMAKRGADLHEFPQWWLDSFPPIVDCPACWAYLEDRGVTYDLSVALDLRFDTKEKRVCFPVRDFKGRLVGLHGRAMSDEAEPRYRMYKQAGHNNPIAWLGESWADLSLPIVVVEGPFDLASVRRVCANVVSPLSASLSTEKLRRMADALEWITLFDRGAGGDAGREKIGKVLGGDHVITHLHPPKGRKDPGEMTEYELRELLEPYVQLTADFS